MSINIKDLVFPFGDDVKSENEFTKLFDSINLNAQTPSLSDVQDITIDRIFNKEDIAALQSSVLQKSRYKSFYITLDSNNRSELSEGLRKFIWEYSYGNLPYRKGFVQTTQKIKNIVGMRIHPISIYHNSSVPLFNYNFTILIEEFASQSVLCHEDRRYHFMLRYNNDYPYTNQYGNPLVFLTLNYYAEDMSHINDYPLLTNLNPNDDGYFWFDKTILDINSFTITLGNPVQQIDFPFIFTTIQGFWVTYGAITNILHTSFKLNTGDIVKIENFTTTNPTADAAIINILNRNEGHVITFIDGANFTIAVDTSTLSAPPVGFTFIIRNISMNISISLEIITL
jgi:hypothetical protein